MYYNYFFHLFSSVAFYIKNVEIFDQTVKRLAGQTSTNFNRSSKISYFYPSLCHDHRDQPSYVQDFSKITSLKLYWKVKRPRRVDVAQENQRLLPVDQWKVWFTEGIRSFFVIAIAARDLTLPLDRLNPPHTWLSCVSVCTPTRSLFSAKWQKRMEHLINYLSINELPLIINFVHFSSILYEFCRRTFSIWK